MANGKDTPDKLHGVEENRFAMALEAGFRRYGLVFLLIIIAAALSGVFSVGYFSHASQVGANNTVHLQYQRFGRLQNQMQLKITVAREPGENTTLVLGGEYMASFETSAIWPQPDNMYSRGQELILVYHPAGQKGDFSVWIYTAPDQPGKAVTTLHVNNAPGMSFWQFIYP
ncbi:hypothetical protein M8013_08465 [Enterobacteriaceae bacterium H4N4]|uniref:Uncharacterized protein n=1 Tax=Silvania confinis TaxID=2926470 RepID=A0A9J6QKF5_9ENTR|nr:hypothetical protein [Silvania confinis]MCU6668781.1 hypothetical protein [Silvania confinis]